MKFFDANNIHQEKIESDVCIIGAGPAGIALAVKLRDSGLNVVIAESGGLKKNDRANDLNFLDIKSNFIYRDGESERNRQIGGTANLWTGRVVPFVFKELLDKEWEGLRENVLPYYDDAFKIFGIDPSIKNTCQENDGELYAYWAQKTERFNYKSQLFDNNNNVGVYYNLSCVGDPVFKGKEIQELAFMNRKQEKILIKSDCFVFAMGTIENVRLLLMIREKLAEFQKCELKNVGRFMMDHPRIWHGDVQRLTDETAISGYQIKRDRWGFYKTGIRNEPGNCRVYCNFMKSRSRLNTLIDFIPSESFQYSFKKLLTREKGVFKSSASQLLALPLIRKWRGVNTMLENYFNDDQELNFNIMTYCEQRPREENHLKLKNEKGKNGLPIPVLINHMHESELEEVLNFYSFLKDYLQRFNCRLTYDSKYLLNPVNYTDAAHLMGGTRYSNESDKSVLEKDLSVKGIQNLHVSGSSVFPTSSVENPTHLIVSISCYLAEVLTRKFE